MQLPGRPEHAQAESLFGELAATLGELPGVSLGRRYGRWCIKLGGHPFIVLDGDRITFRTGPEAAGLLERFPPANLWNPRNGRQSKQCWITHPADHPETIATLAAMAYAWATERRAGSL